MLTTLGFGQNPPNPAPPPQSPPGAITQTPAATPPKDEKPHPWRLSEELGSPSWLKVSGEQRARYESLDNQFRFRNANANPPVQGYGDSEDVLALRTSVLLEAKGEHLGGAFEVLDARQYGTDDSSPVDTTMVNTVDILQAYVDIPLGDLGDGKHRLRIGRETVDLGNRRLIARNAYRNTINSFNAIDWAWTGKTEGVRAFWSMPTERRPNDFDSLQDNEWALDNQSLDLQFAGIHYDTEVAERTRLEVYAFGLEERGNTTRERSLVNPGIRLVRGRKAGNAHFELELTGQLGKSKASTATTARRLDHLAGFGVAAVGYTFETTWNPSITLSYSYATGDQDPNDDDNERYDTLFGARRFEYGPTGIWGAVARANLNSPEFRIVLQPSKSLELMAAARGVWLASERDAWTSSGLRDRSGGSGTDVGQQYECRLRWIVAPQNFEIEVGAVYLAEGSFQDRASGGQGHSSSYAYVQTTLFF